MADTHPTADGAAIPDGPGNPRTGRHPPGSDLADQILRLESEVGQLREALLSARHIGMVIGILAARYNLTTDRSWALLVQLSQRTNVKLREVARVLHDDFDRHPRLDDATLLARIAAKLISADPNPSAQDPGAGEPDTHVPPRKTPPETASNASIVC